MFPVVTVKLVIYDQFDGARAHGMQICFNTDTGIIRNHTQDMARYEKMRSYVSKEGPFAMVELDVLAVQSVSANHRSFLPCLSAVDFYHC